MSTQPYRIGAKKRIIRWPWSTRESTRLDLWPLKSQQQAPAGPSIVPPIFGNEPEDTAAPVPRTRWWWIKRGVQVFVLVFSLILIWLAITAPLSKSLQPIAPPEITLLAADGTPIARNGAVVADPVQVAKLPQHVIQPFLAIEDRRFYSHWGVDPRGIARAAWSNLTTGRTQGGSTITQQLAKFTFLTPEQSITRKAREALIAFWLEAWLTKDEILERYLSNAYFGDNTYGLRAASLHYFYRQPEKLKPEQAAMLAGLLQAPSRLAPTQNPKAARKRMELVLQAMVAAGYLTEAQANAMPVPKVDVRLTGDDLPTGTYFADWALPELRKESDVGYSRQTFTTTLDSKLQAAARRAVARAPLGNAQVALVAMRRNGDVVAMIGGKDYEKSPFNRATQARRQPGSTFKLFVYLAALEAGMKPEDRVSNLPIENGSYRPANASGTYSDSITLQDAFARSSNVAAVRLFNLVGDEAVIQAARDLGITSPLAEGDPSLALGTSTVTLLELTAAYAGVAANSYPVKPRAFAEEESGWFDWLWGSTESLDDSEHEAIEQMLRRAVNQGTGRQAMLSGPNFGKTGTSQDYRDALFIGYAGDLVVGVWVGNDDNSPLKGVTGGTIPARIWRDFMRQALGEREGPVRPTPKPNPSGPVQPQDVLDASDIPLNLEGTDVRIDRTGAVLSTEIDGVPVEVRVNEEGVRFEPRATAAPRPPPTPRATASPTSP
jgi:penicillin-binding protein 1A